ncbi:MAG: integrase core domain-containing protein [Candidatus Acidiferrales bacterium]
MGMGALYIKRGSTSENGYSENFNGNLQVECLNGEIFYSLSHAQAVIEKWPVVNTTLRLHPALDYSPPHRQTVTSCLNGEIFHSQRDAQVVIEKWPVVNATLRLQPGAGLQAAAPANCSLLAPPHPNSQQLDSVFHGSAKLELASSPKARAPNIVFNSSRINNEIGRRSPPRAQAANHPALNSGIHRVRQDTRLSSAPVQGTTHQNAQRRAPGFRE